MYRFIVSILTLLSLGACSMAPRCASPDAADIVAATQPKKTFQAMLTMTVKSTQTAAIVANEDRRSGEAKIQQAVGAAVDRHGEEWEHNLVAGWATLGSPELKRVCAAINNGDQKEFLRFATVVGSEIETKNKPLLMKAAKEVLQQLFSQTFEG